MLDPMVQNAGLQEEEVNGQKLKSNQTQVCVLADLMQDPMIKKAGLREEEVLALMLYTGLCPPPSSCFTQLCVPRAPPACSAPVPRPLLGHAELDSSQHSQPSIRGWERLSPACSTQVCVPPPPPTPPRKHATPHKRRLWPNHSAL